MDDNVTPVSHATLCFCFWVGFCAFALQMFSLSLIDRLAGWQILCAFLNVVLSGLDGFAGNLGNYYDYYGVYSAIYSIYCYAIYC